MPMTRSTAAASSKTEELEKPNESVTMEAEEKVDLDGDNDPEKTIQEEIEYEEVEVEEEVEEEVDEEEEIQEVEEEEVDEEEEEDEDEDDNCIDIDVKEENDDKKKHGELLALPPHGSEVFLGGIPHNATDEDLRIFCQSVGEVTEVKIIEGKNRGVGKPRGSGANKGFAFITFRTKELASKAMEKFNNTELKGKTIRCSLSQAKNKLFIGNIPKSWGEEDLREAVTEIGPGVITIEHLKDPQNSSRTRGYAFVEYYNQACADYSRLKMSNPNFKLGDNSPTVSWASPKSTESPATFQAKVICVKNLPRHVSEDKLKELFGHYGKITKFVLASAKENGQGNSRIGFLHFAESSSAMNAVNPTKKYRFDGRILHCSLARPQTEQGANSQKSPLLPGHLPRVGYGMVGGAYAVGRGGFGAPGLTQPLLYSGMRAAPAGVAMTPMRLPDGRIAYVLQQPGIHAQAHIPPPQYRGGSSNGGRRSYEGGQGRARYNPY